MIDIYPSKHIKNRRRKNLVIPIEQPHHGYVGARRNRDISKSWLVERKEILHKIKEQVRLYLGDETQDVNLYAQAYKADINRPWTPSDLDSVRVTLQQVSMVFGGDFHPFSQAQRSHLRVIRSIQGERKVVLALECVMQKHQNVVNSYLAGEITEDVFLQAVDWDGTWGFPWPHYRPLFEFAKKNNIRVLAVNVEVDQHTGESLHFRDQQAAQVLLDHNSRFPEDLIYVIYGDLHIAQNHLPNAIRQARASDPDFEIATLYLNSEKIYFELAEQGTDAQVEVVRFSRHQYCILSSPPWVKWQSYLMYLEENFDIDLDVDDDDEDEWDFQIDHTDHVSDLVKLISADLEIQMRTDAIEVYSLNDPQVLRVIDNGLKGQERELAMTLVKSDKSFYLPQRGFFYLSKSTVNHAASLAGQYVHARLSLRTDLKWNFPEDFLALIWVETMAFLLSKLVNPKRKAQTMADLKKQLQAFDSEDRGREPLLLALDQKMSELLVTYAGRGRVQTYVPSDKSSYIHAARFIGEMLGERYFLLYQREIIDKDKLKELLSYRLEGEAFTQLYFQQLKLLDQLEA